jgi:hypothetical protein
MRYDWILDVLTDLRAFARANALPHLAEQLDDAQVVALNEIAQRGAAGPVEGDGQVCECHAEGVRDSL